MAQGSDPVAAGVVTNLARPGGSNFTGFINYEYAMAGKWLEILQLAPLTLTFSSSTMMRRLR
jgi:putative tryptophan/tyrosine transport system substrate-binding protein